MDLIMLVGTTVVVVITTFALCIVFMGWKAGR